MNLRERRQIGQGTVTIKLPNYSWLILLAFAAASSSAVAEITGKVREASGDMATVAIDGDAMPAVGDSVEILFRLAGATEDVLVASGKVAAVEAKVVKVKIENASGTVVTDQFVRIKPSSVAKTPGQSPTPASSPSGTAAGSSITGDWVSKLPEGTTVSFSFKEDGSLLWVVEGAEHAQSTRAKYRLDRSTQPQGIELFDIEAGDKAEKIRGVFELQSDGRLKLDFPNGPQAVTDFTKDALVFSRATSPVVPSNKPALPPPTPYQAPPEPPDEVLVTEGMQKYDHGDDAGAMEALEKAIALNPKNARAFFWRGMCFSRKKNWAAAIADFEKANELKPSMNLQDVIEKTKVVLKNEEEAKVTATPEPTRRKTKRKP